MNTPSVHLATTSEEISERAHAARSKGGGRVILVPVDFSFHSEAALVHACELADIMSVAVMVLHVVHDPGEMPGYYSKLIKKKRVGRIQDTAAEAFDEFIVRVSAAHPKLKALQEAERLMVVGLPVTRILEVVEELDPWMVVVGSQGRTGMQHLFIGSKAAQIVQLCPVPVTVVKSKKVKKKE
ncbi:MAG: universal stress protein [Gammaproteobacteria bacterium]|nr:universal stress protein [Gammaproteobacteria bacterium]MDH3428811.1 universal stress protein [Gammaproteobacteria bacterium]